MFEFTCPSCGKRVQGDDSLAGKHVVCPSCNATCTAPQLVSTATAIAEAPHTGAPSPVSEGAFSEGLPPMETAPNVRKPAGWAMTVIYVLVVVAILSTLVGLLVPSVESVREAASQTQSINNLKQIGLAMQSFHDSNKRLPFNGTIPAIAKDPQSGSWAFQILPFLDSQTMFNEPNIHTGVSTYRCPGRGRAALCTTGAWSDYAINPWINDQNGTVDAPDVKRTLLGITDGTANTILAGHGAIDPDRYGGNVAFEQSVDIFRGGNPALARRSTLNQADRRGDGTLHWGGPFSKGTLLVWCDGTVRLMDFVTSGGNIRNGVSDHPDPRPFGDGMTPRNFNHGMGKFLTPTGNEPVTLPD